jgi:hypothetical protein
MSPEVLEQCHGTREVVPPLPQQLLATDGIGGHGR